jgi:hypothetical protein
VKKYVIDILPRMQSLAHEGGMTGVGIAGKLSEVFDDPCPYGVEMKVTDEFGEIGVFLTENGLVAILTRLSGFDPPDH